jgi:hypothetical protein
MLSLVIVAVADVKRGDAGRPHALACLLLSTTTTEAVDLKLHFYLRKTRCSHLLSKQ